MPLEVAGDPLARHDLLDPVDRGSLALLEKLSPLQDPADDCSQYAVVAVPSARCPVVRAVIPPAPAGRASRSGFARCAPSAREFVCRRQAGDARSHRDDLGFCVSSERSASNILIPRSHLAPSRRMCCARRLAFIAISRGQGFMRHNGCAQGSVPHRVRGTTVRAPIHSF